MITEHRAAIETAATAHGLDADLVDAVVGVESSGDRWAFRYEAAFYQKYLQGSATPSALRFARWGPLAACSYGLMQTMFVVAVEVGFRGSPELLFVPSISLDYGCAKLAQLVAWAEGRIPQALAAYNGGKGANGTAPYRNQPYVDRVLKRLAVSATPSTIAREGHL